MWNDNQQQHNEDVDSNQSDHIHEVTSVWTACSCSCSRSCQFLRVETGTELGEDWRCESVGEHVSMLTSS